MSEEFTVKPIKEGFLLKDDAAQFLLTNKAARQLKTFLDEIMLPENENFQQLYDGLSEINRRESHDIFWLGDLHEDKTKAIISSEDEIGFMIDEGLAFVVGRYDSIPIVIDNDKFRINEHMFHVREKPVKKFKF